MHGPLINYCELISKEIPYGPKCTLYLYTRLSIPKPLAYDFHVKTHVSRISVLKKFYNRFKAERTVPCSKLLLSLEMSGFLSNAACTSALWTDWVMAVSLSLLACWWS